MIAVYLPLAVSFFLFFSLLSGRHRGQHGLHGEPLHLGPEDRSDDAYTPDAEGGKRPDRAVLVYSQRCKEACKGVPVVIGGIEASLRRIAHFDYWQEKVRHSAPGGQQGGHPALRQRRARHSFSSPPAGRRRAHRRDHRPARHRHPAQRHSRGLDGDRCQRRGTPGRSHTAAQPLRGYQRRTGCRHPTGGYPAQPAETARPQPHL